MRIFSISALTILLASTSAAQTCAFSYISDPLSSTSTQQPPLGLVTPPYDSCISQILISRYRFLNAPVTITGLAFSMSADTTLRYNRIRVRMGHRWSNALTGNFQGNFDTPAHTVMDTHDYVWPNSFGQWCEIGLQTPFVYTPAAGNLVIEIVVTGVSSASPASTHYREQGYGVFVSAEFQSPNVPTSVSGPWNVFPLVRVCADFADLGWMGESCSGSSGTRPGLGFTGSASLGMTTNVVLSNALPSQFAIVAFGWDISSLFPVSLASYGMPGCWQYFTPGVTSGMVTNNAGVASHALSIPAAPTVMGIVLFSQFYVSDPVINAAGIVSTNLGRIVPGW